MRVSFHNDFCSQLTEKFGQGFVEFMHSLTPEVKIDRYLRMESRELSAQHEIFSINTTSMSLWGGTQVLNLNCMTFH